MTTPMPNADWIVLPEQQGRQAWIAALQAAAARSGRRLHDTDHGDAPAEADRALLLTASAEKALGRQPDARRIAAILDTPDVIVPEGVDQARRHGIVHLATQNFARLALLPRNRVFGPDVVDSGALRLFPDLDVMRPEGTRTAPGPMTRALEIYSQGKATWSGEVLSWLQPPMHAGGFSTLDLTGRPRTIVHGPYFEIPAGRWKATFTLSVDDHSARYLFRADWGGIEVYSSQEFRPWRSGVFEIEMVHDWAAPGAVEFRLLVMEGVFHGEISLSDLTVVRVDAP